MYPVSSLFLSLSFMLKRRGTNAGLSSSYFVSSFITGAVFLSLITIGLDGYYFGGYSLFLLNLIILGAMLGVSYFLGYSTGYFF